MRRCLSVRIGSAQVIAHLLCERNRPLPRLFFACVIDRERLDHISPGDKIGSYKSPCSYQLFGKVRTGRKLFYTASHMSVFIKCETVKWQAGVATLACVRTAYTFFFIRTMIFGSAWFVLKFSAIFRLKSS